MQRLIIIAAVFSFSVMSQAMEEGKVQLPSAQMLRIYLANENCVRNLETFGIQVLDALCEQFGGQETSPKTVQDFIWQKVDEQNCEYLPMSINRIVDNVVERTFQDYPDVYTAFIKSKNKKKATCDFGLK